MREPARLAPAVKGLALVSLFNDVASEMVYPLLPPFVTSLGGGPTALGLIDGASDFAASVLRWWSGRVADRPGTRGPLIASGYLIPVVLRPVLSVVTAAWQVVGIRVLDRVGKGLRSPARDAMIADLTATPMLGRAFGLHRAADHLGAVLGSLVAFELLRRGLVVREVLGASILPGVLALVALGIALRWAGPPVTASGSGSTAGPVAASDPTSGGDRTAGGGGAGAARGAGAALVWLAALASVRLPETLMLLRLQQLGAPILSIPLIWAVLHVVRSAASYPSGLVADRLGVRPALVVGTVVHGAVLIGLGVASSPGFAMAVFLGHGVIAGVTEPAERAAVARLKPTERGQAFGRYQALAGFGALVAGFSFGWIYQEIGATAAFATAAGSGLLVLGGWLTAERRASA